MVQENSDIFYSFSTEFFCQEKFFSEAFSTLAVLSHAAAVAKLVGAGRGVEKLSEIVHCRLGDVLKRLFGQKRLMRGNYHVGHRDKACERVVLKNVSRVVLEEEVSLLLVNVKAGGADLARFYSREKRLGVNQSAA